MEVVPRNVDRLQLCEILEKGWRSCTHWRGLSAKGETNYPSDASPDEYQRRHRGATLGDSGAATTQLLNAGSRMPGPNRHTSTVRGTLCDRRMTPAAGRLLPGVSSPWRKKGCI
jgi:hypothetical protein